MIKRSILFTSSAALALAVSCSQSVAQSYDRSFEEKPFLKKERSRAVNLVELHRLSLLLTQASVRSSSRQAPAYLLPRARSSVPRAFSTYQGAF